MNIKETNDKLYPMSISDSWGGDTFIHLWTITDDKEWNAFIAELNEVREKILKKIEKRS